MPNPMPYSHDDRPTIYRVISDQEWIKKYDSIAQIKIKQFQSVFCPLADCKRECADQVIGSH